MHDILVGNSSNVGHRPWLVKTTSRFFFPRGFPCTFFQQFLLWRICFLLKSPNPSPKNNGASLTNWKKTTMDGRENGCRRRKVEVKARKRLTKLKSLSEILTWSVLASY